jgi:hypothetical protein
MYGILVFQDVVQDVEVMKQNEYFGEKSSMPNDMDIPAHAEKVLRQIKGAHIFEGGGRWAATRGLGAWTPLWKPRSASTSIPHG